MSPGHSSALTYVLGHKPITNTHAKMNGHLLIIHQNECCGRWRCSYAPLMLSCLLNMAEFHLLRGEPGTALAFWDEARQLLNTLYLTTELTGCFTDDQEQGQEQEQEPPGDPGQNQTQQHQRGQDFRQQGPEQTEHEMARGVSKLLAASTPPAGAVPDDHLQQHQQHDQSSKPASLLLPEHQALPANTCLFPSARAPGIHTPPGLTLRVQLHVTRLLRVTFFSGNARASVGNDAPTSAPLAVSVPAASDAQASASNEADMSAPSAVPVTAAPAVMRTDQVLTTAHRDSLLGSWQWLADKVWAQYSFAAAIALPEVSTLG